MSRYLKIIVTKEVKELIRDPRILIGIILVPLLMFPLMGYAFSLASESAEKELMSLKVSVLDEDKSELSRVLLETLRSTPNVVLSESNTSDVDEWLRSSWGSGARVAIRIPRGFESNITSGTPGVIEVYAFIRSLSMAETSALEFVNSLVRSFERNITISIIERNMPHANASTILNPILEVARTVVKGNVTDMPPQTFMSAAMSQSYMMPIVVMLLIMLAAQLAVTSVAMEKEEKTLETLLTLPVKRVTILWGKLAGSAIVAIAGVAAYMVGFMYYMNTASSSFWTEGMPQASIGVPLEGYMLLAVSLFFSLMSALAIAVLLGAYTQDVRSAHSLLGILYIPVFVPAFILMFSDISTLPLGVQIVLYAIPFSHPMIAAKSIVFGDYFIAVVGIIYNALFMVAVLYVAARFFSSEKIVTAKISWGRRRALGG